MLRVRYLQFYGNVWIALVAKLTGLRFFFAGFVLVFGPVAAIRAEMPRISVVFASIGLRHGVSVLFRQVSGLTIRAMVENTMERREKISKSTSGKCLRL